jgi:hypothetical protein
MTLVKARLVIVNQLFGIVIPPEFDYRRSGELDHLLSAFTCQGHGADLLETRGWNDLANGVIEASYLVDVLKQL